MLSLNQQHPCAALEFQKGKFAAHNPTREYTAMAIDLAVVKGEPLESQRIHQLLDGGWRQAQKLVTWCANMKRPQHSRMETNTD